MPAFPQVLKAFLYLFIAAWMFVLGIMVGRGNSPVSFDTKGFQQRLEKIAGQFGTPDEPEGQIELKFYDVLDRPVASSGSENLKDRSEIVPREEKIIEIKTSTKKRTFKAKLPAKASVQKKKDPSPYPGQKAHPPSESGPWFTIQVAAYKNVNDAAAHVKTLHKKGIQAYHEKSQINKVTWHRVRAGAFTSMEAAKNYKDKLARLNIKAVIVNSDRKKGKS